MNQEEIDETVLSLRYQHLMSLSAKSAGFMITVPLAVAGLWVGTGTISKNAVITASIFSIVIFGLISGVAYSLARDKLAGLQALNSEEQY